MKEQIIDVIYTYNNYPKPHESITFFTEEDPGWIDILKFEDGTLSILRRERDAFGKIHIYPELPDVREYDSEEGKFQLSLIWNDDIDVDFLIKCQLKLFPLFGTHKYSTDLQYTIQY